MTIKPLALAVTLAAAAWSGMAAASVAPNAGGTLTADNEFWLYTGNLTGSTLQFVGEGHDWTVPVTLSFHVNPGDYLYVLAHDTGQPHSWQGTFTTPVGTIDTNATDWVGANVANTTTVTTALIAGATFEAIGSDLSYNSGPWGSRVGSVDADWIWTSGIYSGDVTALFRTAAPVSAVPVPAAFALMAPALGLLGAARRRRAA